MNDDLRDHWDRRYAERGIDDLEEIGPYPLFVDHADLFPSEGTALEIACGRGRGAVWLATRGMSVAAVDLSPVAVDLARTYAQNCGVAARCSFGVHDLDCGLPAGDSVDLVLCHLFRDPSLDAALVDRLRPGGLLAVGVLSEVGARPGRFRARPGELREAFGSLEILGAGESSGYAWLIGRRPSSV